MPKIGGKLRSLVVAMTGGEYGAEDARKLFEALCKGIINIQFELVLISSNQLQPNCSLDWFELIWTGFLQFSLFFWLLPY